MSEDDAAPQAGIDPLLDVSVRHPERAQEGSAELGEDKARHHR